MTHGMEIVWSKEVDTILSRGRSLSDVGVRNWALSRADALSAIDEFERIGGVALLGGDVYEQRTSIVKSNRDNWHCDRATHESDQEFVRRSLDLSKKYIEKYNRAGQSVLFALVPRVIPR